MPDMTDYSIKGPVNYETFERIADRCDGSVRDDYSGRGMYNRSCMGVTVSQHDLVKCIETAAIAGVTGARFDNMGLDMIVYWPDYKASDLDGYEADDEECAEVEDSNFKD